MVKAEVVVKAQFYDLDPMGVVWHGNYAKFIEQARCELLDKIGYNYEEMRESGYLWPIVDMRIKYVRPVRFAQRVRVVAMIDEYKYRLKIKYEIFDCEENVLLTIAQTTQLAVTAETQELQFESPPELIEKVEKFITCI